MRRLKVDIIEGEGLLTLEEPEKHHAAKILEKTGCYKDLAARNIDVPRTALWRKLKSYKPG